MNEQSEHLSNAQIENYGDRPSGTASADHQTEERQSNDQQSEEQRVEAHLDGCPSCRSRVLDFHRTRFGLADSTFAISKGADLKITDSNIDRKHTDGGFTGADQPADRKSTDVNLADSGLMENKLADALQAAPTHAGQNIVDPRQLTARPVNTAPTTDCPSIDDLRQLAAGLLPDALSDKLFRHASTCDYCSPLLQIYTEDFSDDFSPEEQAVLSSLKSSSTTWQQQTARQMLSASEAKETIKETIRETKAGATAGAARAIAGTSAATKATTADSSRNSASDTTAKMSEGTANVISPKPVRSPFFWKWLPIPAAAALTAAVCLIVVSGSLGVWYARRDTPEKVEKLLVQAYTEQRTMEMRWPGASYSTIKSTRGADHTANLALLEARQIVAGHQEPQWAFDAASVALFQQHSDVAIQLLRPVATGPICDRCTLALAIANIAEGDSTGVGKNYETALMLINSIPSNSSEHNVAIYNRALVYERLGKTNDAIADWRTVLEIEKNAGWRSEATQRLDDLLARQPR